MASATVSPTHPGQRGRQSLACIMIRREPPLSFSSGRDITQAHPTVVVQDAVRERGPVRPTEARCDSPAAPPGLRREQSLPPNRPVRDMKALLSSGFGLMALVASACGTTAAFGPGPRCGDYEHVEGRDPHDDCMSNCLACGAQEWGVCTIQCRDRAHPEPMTPDEWKHAQAAGDPSDRNVRGSSSHRPGKIAGSPSGGVDP